jgi:hypothetical protein
MSSGGGTAVIICFSFLPACTLLEHIERALCSFNQMAYASIAVSAFEDATAACRSSRRSHNFSLMRVTSAASCFKSTQGTAKWSSTRHDGVKLISIWPPGKGDFEVRYTFRAVEKAACNGRAVVTIVKDGDLNLIQGTPSCE